MRKGGRDSQAFATAVNECLAQALVLGDGLQNGAVRGDIANGPLTQPRAAQPEYVPAHTHTNTHTHRAGVNDYQIHLNDVVVYKHNFVFLSYSFWTVSISVYGQFYCTHPNSYN